MLCQLMEIRKVGRLAVLVCTDVIVCLSLQEVCYQYWPSGSTQTYGEFTVEVLGEENFQGFCLRTFGVLNTKVSPSHYPQCTCAARVEQLGLSVLSSELETMSTLLEW